VSGHGRTRVVGGADGGPLEAGLVLKNGLFNGAPFETVFKLDPATKKG
jgi:hypothetical protein